MTTASDSLPATSLSERIPFLQIKRVVKKFDEVFAVDEVTLNIEKGEIFALLGSSGCGKSTLLRMLAGFEQPTSGQILLEGRDIVGLAPYERPINMMFQSYALFPHLTVLGNVLLGKEFQASKFGARLTGSKRRAAIDEARQLIGEVGLSASETKYPAQLSGGEQQRVAIARTLLKNPPILIFDEATSALDNETEKEVTESIDSLSDTNKTIFIIAHRITTLKNCDRIIELKNGKISGVYKYNDLLEKVL